MSEHITDQNTKPCTDQSPRVEQIYQNIVDLQKQMTNSMNAMAQLSECLSRVIPDPVLTEDDAETVNEAVEGVCAAFACREENFRLMIQLYEKMLNRAMAEEKAAKMMDQMEMVAERLRQLKAEECEPRIYDSIVETAQRMLAYDIH